MFSCAYWLFMYLLLQSFCKTLPLYCDLLEYIARPSFSEKPVAPATENATGSQFSVVNPFRDCFSCTKSCHPKDMPLHEVAHIQVVHTGPHHWMTQKYEGLLVILSQLWSINLVPELCMKSAKAVKLFHC